MQSTPPQEEKTCAACRKHSSAADYQSPRWGAVIPEHARKRQRTAGGRRTVMKNRKQICLLIDTSYNRRGNRNSAAKVEDILEKLQKF